MFTKASKKKAKLRCAVFGPSGSGKTFTSLRIAKGLVENSDNKKIAVADTERCSASKYSDRFDFDVCELEKKTVRGYCEMIRAAADGGYAVLIIDSLTHAWQELLEQVEKLAQAKYKGNTWSAWSEGTPLQRELIDAILEFPGHIIATMRSKTEWTTVKQDNGRSAPVRVGLAPEQGKGIEYEFDLLIELSVDHLGSILKDRTGKWQDEIITKPDEDFGKSLADWLNDGAEPAKPEPPRELTDDEKKAKNVGMIRALIIKAFPGDQSTDGEHAFCDKTSALCEDNRKRARLEEFTLDELRLIYPKAKTMLKDLQTNGTAPVAA